jgi:putative aldouronate transport system substrate-binding protein
MIKLLDFMYTAEGSVMVRCGPSNDEVEGGWTMIQVDGVDTFETHYAEYGYTSFWYFRALNTIMSAPYVDSAETKVAQYLTYADPQQRWLTESVLVDTNNVQIARIPYPDVSFTEAEMETINSFVDMESYVDQMEAKFITGEAPMSEFDSFVAKLKGMNVEKMIEVRQAAYERWVG